METDSTVAASALLGSRAASGRHEQPFVGTAETRSSPSRADDADLVTTCSTTRRVATRSGYRRAGVLSGSRTTSAATYSRIFDITNRLGPPRRVWTRAATARTPALAPAVEPPARCRDPTLLDRTAAGPTSRYGGPRPTRFHDDDDGDGFTFVQDCNDNEPDAFPDAPEVCDGADQDCDGLVDDGDPDITGQDTFYADCDFDGQGAGAPRVQCDAPQGAPVCGGRWLSLAAVGSLATSDCDDTDPAVFTGAPESCDTIDDDCDGVDDDPAVTGQDSFFPLRH